MLGSSRAHRQSPSSSGSNGVLAMRHLEVPENVGRLSGLVLSKAILSYYIKATIGFEKLGEATGTQPKSLIRMFGRRGNPQAKTSSLCSATCRGRPGLSCM
jgi:hypothetical protein